MALEEPSEGTGRVSGTGVTCLGRVEGPLRGQGVDECGSEASATERLGHRCQTEALGRQCCGVSGAAADPVGGGKEEWVKDSDGRELTVGFVSMEIGVNCNKRQKYLNLTLRTGIGFVLPVCYGN